MRATRLIAILAASATLPACAVTSSTEVGVRTSLFGVLEKRGQQETYPPGGFYFVAPIVNAWAALPISQQNLTMTADPTESDRPVPDDITFKTKDGNNVYIDVNVMWRVDPTKADYLISHVGQSIAEIKERLVRPICRSVIRDVFNQITSEEYYQVTVKNRLAGEAAEQLTRELTAHGIIIEMLQVQQHRFDSEYQAAINAQKQAEADVQTLIQQQRNMEVQKKSELEAKRATWNQQIEDSLGQAGRARNQADAYYQTKTNEAKAIVAGAQAEAEGVRKEAYALSKMGGEAFVKMQVAKQLSQKKILLVPGTNVATMDVNKMVDYLMAESRKNRAARGDD